MKVKLISMTPSPIDVMWTAARTCYSAKSPIEMWEDRYGTTSDDCEHTQEYIDQCIDKHWNLVQKVLSSGHQSIAEHVYFTFAIEGISRACSHQLVRHRAGIVFSQQSQRYVEVKEDFRKVYDLMHALKPSEVKEELKGIVSLYFTDVTDDNYYAYAETLLEYIRNINNGKKAEDARAILPNATKTNITMSLNYRELIHICNLRLCTRAQLEIRKLFQTIKAEVEKAEPRLAEYLRPNCEVHNMCFEDKCCGKKPKVNEVTAIYNLLEDDTVLSKTDWEQLMNSIKEEPKVNKKLQDLIKAPSILDL